MRHIHVYTGEGKGKSTAAFGLALRAIGQNMPVKIVQFFKKETGEKNILKNFCNYSQFQNTHPFLTANPQEEIERLKGEFEEFWNEELNDLEKNRYELIILDEVGPLISSGISDDKTIIDFIEKNTNAEIILTGRDMPDTIKSISSYVTDMRKVKHPFDNGLNARKGIEF